ncbi:MAG: thiamine phosphate synthase [Candidatus Hydrogenedentales bacterium]|jgi:thiamine-phosphate pyrophosphorylase
MDLPSRIAVLDRVDLYVVITESLGAGRTSLEILDACLAAGVRMVQLREKDKDDRDVYALGKAWREATRKAGALFLVDDRLDIALAVDADGVHLGLSDLPITAARRLAPHMILGASSHNLDEALSAQQEGASYVNIGPIFPTQTKIVATGAIGPEAIAHIRPHLHVPYTCMGGIKENNVGLVLDAGAQIVAVVTAVIAAPNIGRAATALRNRIQENRRLS